METEARTGEDEGGAIGDAGRSCPQYPAPNRDEATAQAEEEAQLTTRAERARRRFPVGSRTLVRVEPTALERN